MMKLNTLAVAASLAVMALVATDLSASAQSTLTNGPDGEQPGALASDNPASAQGKAPSRARMMRRGPRGLERHTSDRRRGVVMARPLTVRPAVVAVPAPVANVGPGTIVTAPLGIASAIVSLPFRALNGIFPATGDVNANPLVVIGAPLRAAGDIAQIPFRIIGAPFGGTTIAID